MTVETHPVPAREHHAPAVWFLRGARHGISVPALVLFASYIGYGAVLQSVGFPLFAGLASTFLVWALPAQLILIGGLVAGTALPVLAFAVGLSSMRLLPMVVSISPYLRGERRSLITDLVCAHYVAMTLWLEGLRLLPRLPGEARVPFVLGLGNTLVAISVTGTYLGFHVAGEVPFPLAAGLLLLTPLSFTVMMVRNASTPTDWLAVTAGLLITPFVIGLEGGLDLLIAGIGGGTVAFLGGRYLERQR